jgi:hypothetical protein
MKEEKLKELLVRYYKGETSQAEETELKKYFSGDEVFKGYEAEKEIFRHYSESEIIPVPSVDFEARIIKALDDIDMKRRKLSLKKRYIYILGAAAAILVLIGSYLIFSRQKEPVDTYSDPQMAYAAAMKILNEVSVKLNKGTRALRPMGRIKDATRTGFNSVDRSAVIISKNLQRIKLLEQISVTDNQMNNKKQ